MPSSSKLEKLSFFISTLSLLIAIFSCFFVVDSNKLIALSILEMIGLTLVCTIISVCVTNVIFSSRRRQEMRLKTLRRFVVCFLAGAFTVVLAIIFIVWIQKSGLGKSISQPVLIEDIQFSPEELIQKNSDFIETKISEYTESDIQQVNNKYVNFLVCENAGNLLYDEGDGSELTCEVLGGKTLASAMVVILDPEFPTFS